MPLFDHRNNKSNHHQLYYNMFSTEWLGKEYMQTRRTLVSATAYTFHALHEYAWRIDFFVLKSATLWWKNYLDRMYGDRAVNRRVTVNARNFTDSRKIWCWQQQICAWQLCYWHSTDALAWLVNTCRLTLFAQWLSRFCYGFITVFVSGLIYVFERL